MDYTIPDAVSAEQANKIDSALEEIGEMTIEDREYAMSRHDLDEEGGRVRKERGLYYLVTGEQPLAESVSIEIDDDGTLAEGEDRVRIGILFSGSEVQWRSGNFGPDLYNKMQKHGIEKPEGNPSVGVQFRFDPDEGKDRVILENTVPVS